MNATPDVIGAIEPRPHSIESAMEAAIKRMEEDSHVIRGLRKQNERLAAEKLNVELEASISVAKHKFSEAQMFQRVLRIEKDLDQLRNWITGHVVQRDELEAVRAKLEQVASDYYAHSARSDC